MEPIESREQALELRDHPDELGLAPATPDDIGNLFQRLCHLHGITPKLAVLLAKIWLRREQIARLQAMLAGHPQSNGGSAPVSSGNGACSR